MQAASPRARFIPWRYLRNRIALFLELPLDALDAMATQRKLKEIGQSEGASAQAGASA